MKDLWYHNAIIYALDVETYMDSDHNGVGDFQGLISRLDYLAGLGINCIWLRPFYPSPLKDDGYDVMDYYGIDERLGNHGDFVDLVYKADALGIKILIDLVVNHTSNKHPWFEESRRNKNSKYRDYYIWSDKPDSDYVQKNILEEGGIWTYDELADAYYLHHFYKEQPDLNVSNPNVKSEIKKIMGFWLQMGVAGFRIDAAHILTKDAGGRKNAEEQVMEILEEMREFIQQRKSDAILLAEANTPINELKKFFGNGNRMHLLFNFITNKHLFLSMARENPKPLINALEKMRSITGQWVNFLRHHDELNLEMLQEEERNEVFEAFAPDKDMRIFGHGIRRRLPPMLNGNRKRLELIYAVTFCLPGIPLINYGEEIGMGDDLSQKGRSSVRTVMQWDEGKNAGFSFAPKIELEHSVIDFGEYDYKKINVAAQQKDLHSFLNWMERLISTRRQCPQIGYGEWEILKTNVENVFCIYSKWMQDSIITIHNFSKNEKEVELIKTDIKFDSFSEVFSDSDYHKVSSPKEKIILKGYGYRWFKLYNANG
jgi:maltose alpha-D-glucosyltransferase / alpha-amylase